MRPKGLELVHQESSLTVTYQVWSNNYVVLGRAVCGEIETSAYFPAKMTNDQIVAVLRNMMIHYTMSVSSMMGVKYDDKLGTERVVETVESFGDIGQIVYLRGTYYIRISLKGEPTILIGPMETEQKARQEFAGPLVSALLYCQETTWSIGSEGISESLSKHTNN